MNKTICFFNTAIPWGGGEKWHFEMAKYLHESGHFVVIFCHKKSILFEKAKAHNIPYKTISNSNTSFLNPLKLLYFSKLLQKYQIGTLVLNLSQDVKSGGIAAKLAGVKRIIYRRGSAIPVRNSSLNRFLFKNIIDEVLVNSKATQDCILQNNTALFPKDYIKVIPNGIDGQTLVKKDFNPYYKRKSSELILTNLGRLEEQKNQLFLVDVANELRDRGLDFHMIIGGSGRLEASIKAKINTYKLESFIKLVGFVENPKDLYMSGDLFLLPSLWEGFGYVITEAGLSQKPTIAFDISSNPEVIVENKSGILVPANDVIAFCDAIMTFDKNRERIIEMGAFAQKHILDSFDKVKLNKKLANYLTKKETPKISAIVTTYNEEKNIENCLNSIEWADEILVIDSFSTDNTVPLCEKFGARVLQRKYNYAADQKNWAIPQAKHPWIVLLDADEMVSENLAAEIKEILRTRPKQTAFWVRRTNFFLGKKVRFCGWQNDRVVRLFYRDYHRYENKMVHAEIEHTKPFGSLNSTIIHHTTSNLEHYTKKIERYAHYAAQSYIKKNKNIGLFNLYIKPTFKFLNSYILRGGVLDGKTGWIICKLRAQETWLKARIALDYKNENKY
ncbi:MAG: glycosyltransferase [Bacteroidetes bacterium]|nr:glycosyltransferase [Bacteroidota bacterium]